MILKDDRTPEQKKTYIWAVKARDNFMSGWGHAQNGYSYCAWAVDDINKLPVLLARIKDRNEMRYVEEVDLRTYRPRAAHFHIYVDTSSKGTP